jgi:hypothetical protein
VKATSGNQADRRTSTRKIGQTQVPDQYWGYSLQTVRFLQVLLEAPAGTVVSLEVFEDVGLSDGLQKVASQVKTGLIKNPLTDRAIEFWKTLANWVSATINGDLDPALTIFELYVAKPRKGHLATLFHNARSEDEAAAAIQKARQMMLGNRRATKALPKELSPYVKTVLQCNEKSLRVIIRNFRITSAVRNPLADLRPVVIAKWVRPESIDVVIQHAHGWLKERLDTLLQARQPAVISTDEFNEEMRKFMPRCDFQHIVTNMAGRPTAEQIAAQKVRTFVRQLELIELEEEGSLEAINAYLRATVTRTRLSEEGIVHEDSFSDFEDGLISFWRNKRRQNSLTHPNHNEIQKGQLLLSDCCLTRARLQGLEVPDYFTPGSFHALADDALIGWHPKYEALLNESAKQ